MTTGFENGLRVCVGNYGYYHEGELHDAWITLPKSEEEIEEFLNKHQLQDAQHEEIYIFDYDGIPFDLTEVFNEYASLEDLNLLAKQLQDMDDHDEEAVSTWIESCYTPSDVIELMNLIEQADDIPYYEYRYNGDNFWTKEEKFGWEMIDNDPEVSEFLENHSSLQCSLDVEKYGREMSFDMYLGENGYINNEFDFTRTNAYDRDYFECEYGI